MRTDSNGRRESARWRIGPPPGVLSFGFGLLAAAVFAPGAAAQEATPDSVQESQEREPCSVVELDPNDRADWLRSKVYRTACGSALWFDSFFRDDRLISETAGTHGWVQLGVSYRSVEEWEPYTKARVKVALPAAERRLNLFLGKDDPDAILMDTDDASRNEEQLLGPEEEDEWLLGLGYTPVNSRMNNLSFGAGVSLVWPPDPYVRAQYRYNWEVTEVFLVRLMQTGFWKNSESVGTTSRVDLERPIGTRALARWYGRGTVSRYRWGLEWASGITLFHNVGGPQAFAYKVFAEGLTGLPYNIGNYGFSVIYRRRTGRKWLWLEIPVGISWPRFTPEEDRRTNPGIAVILEVRFP
jgi:hypothetical protein